MPGKGEQPDLLAVVFDLDDTLYAERDYVRSGYRAAGRHLRAAVGRDEPFEDWLWERFCAGQSANAFDALSERFALGLSDGQIAELVEVYRRHRPDIRPFPGVRELLDGLAGRYRLGLLTDGYLPAQRLKLEALSLAGAFRAVVFTEDLGREAWKPSTAGFELIARRLEAPHARCCYVADNPAKDFVGPNRLGWYCIRYAEGGGVHASRPAPEGGEAHAVVRSADELGGLLL
ncbi:MAG TPA: HAD family hydrolase [Phycisphaerae bacterium]|nr:HAD family hydrolase [Phycisphaerae bacterium]